MKKLNTLLLMLFAVKFSNATGYSGLNNDLILIYAILIGFIVSIILLKKIYKNFKEGKNKQTDQHNSEPS